MTTDHPIRSWVIARHVLTFQSAIYPWMSQLQEEQLSFLALSVRRMWAGPSSISPRIKTSQYAQQLHGGEERMHGMCLQHHNSSPFTHGLIWPGQKGIGHTSRALLLWAFLFSVFVINFSHFVCIHLTFLKMKKNKTKKWLYLNIFLNRI